MQTALICALTLTLASCNPAPVATVPVTPTPQEAIAPSPVETVAQTPTPSPTPTAQDIDEQMAIDDLTLFYLQNITDPPVFCRTAVYETRNLMLCEHDERMGLWEIQRTGSVFTYVALNGTAKEVAPYMPQDKVTIAPYDYPVNIQDALTLFE